MNYAFIDTNIWLRVISQGRPGCEVEHLEDLRGLVGEGKVTLLLPEVVELELEKNWRTFMDELKASVAKLEKELEQPLRKSIWSEIDDLQSAMKTELDSLKTRKMQQVTERYQKVESLLAYKQVVRLPFNESIHLRARKRLIAGRMPVPENKASNDACIVETLAAHFESVKLDHDLCFCTDNLEDFGLNAGGQEILHPLVAGVLPKETTFCRSLTAAVDLIKSRKKPEHPTPEVVEEALERKAMGDQVRCIFCSRQVSPLSVAFCEPHRREMCKFTPEKVLVRYNLLLKSVVWSASLPESMTIVLDALFLNERNVSMGQLERVLGVSTEAILRYVDQARESLWKRVELDDADCLLLDSVPPEVLNRLRTPLPKHISQHDPASSDAEAH